MGNLLASLLTSAGAMRTFEKALGVVQNNVSNASTPGYAKQRLPLEALRFEPTAGLPGGVTAGELQSFRSQFAEQAVRRQQELYGRYAQQALDLAQIEPVLPIAENTGIPAMISKLFQGFSALAVSPNDTSARQIVIDRAEDVARSFNQAASGLADASRSAQKPTGDVVAQINDLAGQIRDINLERRWNLASRSDAGLDAKLHVALENLAELVNFTVLQHEDGTVSVLLGGQSPVVIGERQMQISADFSSGQAAILDADGRDVTGVVQQGRLAALLDLKNTVIPSYVADLDRLAQEFADQINLGLAQGVDAAGNRPALNLFTYDADRGIAQSLAVSGIAPSELAAASPGAPGGNGNALALAGLATSRVVDGFTFAEFYGNLAARAGRGLAAAQASVQSQGQLLAQARSLRSEASGVSLDEEAAHLIEFQRAYQASARLLTVLNDLTDTVINLLH